MSSQPKCIMMLEHPSGLLFCLDDFINAIDFTIEISEDGQQMKDCLVAIRQEIEGLKKDIKLKHITGQAEEDTEGMIMYPLEKMMKGFKDIIMSLPENSTNQVAHCYCYNMLKQLLEQNIKKEFFSLN